jgi:hypothetical protein
LFLIYDIAQSRERGKLSVRRAMRQQTTFVPARQKQPRFSTAMTLTTSLKSV